jgi:hypothetical protein
MRFWSTRLLPVCLIAMTGCMTSGTVKKAKNEDKPGYYALLPLTVPADIATSPFQGIWYLFDMAGTAVSLAGAGAGGGCH